MKALPLARRCRPTLLESAFAAVTLAAAAGAQVAWQQLTPGTPPPRFVHTISSEPGGRVLMFGGYSTAASWHGDTWAFDWQTWQQLAPAHSPSNRSGHGLTFDLWRNRAVLFGGNDGSGAFNDTWEWDGVDWIAIGVPAASAPPARTWNSLTFDVLRGKSVLFGGGSFGSSTAFADTWTWDGTVWRNVPTAATPPARSRPALAFDLSRGNVVMFGGRTGVGSDLGDTWTFDGSNWTQWSPAHIPSARQFSSMVFDLGRGRAVLFGGMTSGLDLADTWEWDGADWRQRLPNGSPSPRQSPACMFEPGNGRVVLFGGGLGVTGNPVYADTWTYGAFPAALVSPFGTGCSGTSGTPQLTGNAASVGTTLQVSLSGLSNSPFACLVVGTSRTVWGTTPLPLDLAVYGMPGCRLLASADVSVLLATTSGAASLNTPVPANPALAGMHLYVQGISFDPAANAGGAVFSNGLDVRIGGS
jgi:hypothetical protein